MVHSRCNVPGALIRLERYKPAHTPAQHLCLNARCIHIHVRMILFLTSMNPTLVIRIRVLTSWARTWIRRSKLPRFRLTQATPMAKTRSAAVTVIDIDLVAKPRMHDESPSFRSCISFVPDFLSLCIIPSNLRKRSGSKAFAVSYIARAITSPSRCGYTVQAVQQHDAPVAIIF